jgi:hypothetical protein
VIACCCSTLDLRVRDLMNEVALRRLYFDSDPFDKKVDGRLLGAAPSRDQTINRVCAVENHELTPEPKLLGLGQLTTTVKEARPIVERLYEISPSNGFGDRQKTPCKIIQQHLERAHQGGFAALENRRRLRP